VENVEKLKLVSLDTSIQPEKKAQKFIEIMNGVLKLTVRQQQMYRLILESDKKVIETKEDIDELRLDVKDKALKEYKFSEQTFHSFFYALSDKQLLVGSKADFIRKVYNFYLETGSIIFNVKWSEE
jgi:hypothetical protein